MWLEEEDLGVWSDEEGVGGVVRCGVGVVRGALVIIKQLKIV